MSVKRAGSARARAERRLKVLLSAETGRMSVKGICERAGISRTLFYRWRSRLRAEGPTGLADRSRRPRGHPRTTPTEVVARIVFVRLHFAWGPDRIRRFLAQEHGIAMSGPGVWKVLARLGLSRIQSGSGHPGRPRKGAASEPPSREVDLSIWEDRSSGPGGLCLYFAADVAAGMTIVRAYDRRDPRTAVAFLGFALGWLPFRPHAVRTEPGPEFGGPFQDFLAWHGMRHVIGRPLGGLSLEAEAVGVGRLRRGMVFSANSGLVESIRTWENRAGPSATAWIGSGPFTGRAGSGGPRSR
jgi:transposase